jgi:hypothetical protein
MKNRVRNNARLQRVHELRTRALVAVPQALDELQRLELELAFMTAYIQPTCHPEPNAPKSRVHRRMCRRGAKWIDRQLDMIETTLTQQGVP